MFENTGLSDLSEGSKKVRGMHEHAYGVRENQVEYPRTVDSGTVCHCPATYHHPPTLDMPYLLHFHGFPNNEEHFWLTSAMHTLGLPHNESSS